MNLLKNRLWQQVLLARRAQQQPKTSPGFTLIELLVVIIIVGVLAAIAAPGWLGFVNQRRVNATNNLVLLKIEEAKSKARKEKLDYSVTFENNGNSPRVAIHQENAAPTVWESPSDSRPGKVILQNFVGVNSTPSNSTKITFDSTGILKGEPNLPINIVVAQINGTTISPSSKRCVRVRTLLGGLTSGRGEETAAKEADRCPK